MSENKIVTDNNLLESADDSGVQSEGYYSSVDEENENKTVLDGVPRSRGWSVAALILGILSIVLSIIPFLGFLHGVFGPIFGIMAIIASLVSRRNLGYFDGVGIAGIILGTVGCVFGATAILFGAFFG